MLDILFFISRNSILFFSKYFLCLYTMIVFLYSIEQNYNRCFNILFFQFSFYHFYDSLFCLILVVFLLVMCLIFLFFSMHSNFWLDAGCVLFTVVMISNCCPTLKSAGLCSRMQLSYLLFNFIFFNFSLDMTWVAFTLGIIWLPS